MAVLPDPAAVPVLTVTDLVAISEMSRSWVYLQVQEGRIPSVWLMNRRGIPNEDLRASQSWPMTGDYTVTRDSW